MGYLWTKNPTISNKRENMKIKKKIKVRTNNNKYYTAHEARQYIAQT